MPFLFHPAHRKFIKTLRSYADRGVIISITAQDKERYYEIFHRTDTAIERHKVAYKILLEILNRDTPKEEGSPLTHKMVDSIEEFISHLERRNPCQTFSGVIIMPLLRYFIRRL